MIARLCSGHWTLNRTSVIRNVVGRLGNKNGSPPPLGVFILQSGRTAEGEDGYEIRMIDERKPQRPLYWWWWVLIQGVKAKLNEIRLTLLQSRTSRACLPRPVGHLAAVLV